MSETSLEKRRTQAALSVLIFGAVAAAMPLVAVLSQERGGDGTGEIRQSLWKPILNLLAYFLLMLLPYAVVAVAVRVSRPADWLGTVVTSSPLLLWGGLIVVMSCNETWRAVSSPRPAKPGMSNAILLTLFTMFIQYAFACFVLFLSATFRHYTRPDRRRDTHELQTLVEFSAPVAYARIPPSPAPQVNRATLRVSRVLFVVALCVGLLLFGILSR